VYYYHLMSDDTPANPLPNHPPYVTSREALTSAEKEAVARGKRVQIFRTYEREVSGQPWQVVDPPDGETEPGLSRWHYEASIAANEATREGALKQGAETLRESLAAFDVRANASDDLLIVRVTVGAATEEEASAMAFDLVDTVLDEISTWTERRWAQTRIWKA